MRDHLKEVFKERIDIKNKNNFLFSTISPFNINKYSELTWNILEIMKAKSS